MLRRCTRALRFLLLLQRRRFGSAWPCGSAPLPPPWADLRGQEEAAPKAWETATPWATHPEVHKVSAIALSAPVSQLGGASTVEAWILLRAEDLRRSICVARFVDARDCLEADLGAASARGFAVCEGRLQALSGHLNSQAQVTEGKWHHVACTFDGAERRLWLDYELVASDHPGFPTGPEDLRVEAAFYEGPWTADCGQESCRGARAELRHLRIWEEALTPEAMRAYDAYIEDQARAALSRSAELDGRGSLLRAFGPALAKRLGGRGLEALRPKQPDPAFRSLLRALAANLRACGGNLQTPPEAALAREILAVLQPVGATGPWQVQAKAAEFSEDMPERLLEPGFLRFRKQVHVADSLLDAYADEMLLELADNAAIQVGSEGNHDECWTKMPRLSSWASLPIAHASVQICARLGDLSLRQKLGHVLARALAAGLPWEEALEESLQEICKTSNLKQKWAALLVGCEKLARVEPKSLAGLVDGILDAAAADPEVSLKAKIEEMFASSVSALLYFRFAILLEVNWLVRNSLLPFVDLASAKPTALGRLLRQQKPRLLGHLKFARFQQVLKQTRHDGAAPTITLNRKLAMSVKERDRVDWELRRSMTGQFMNEVRRSGTGSKLFRRPWLTRAVKVQFKGEGGEDAGGLYREALEAVVRELHSTSLALLVPCPNAVAEVGENRDCWILSPSATSAAQLEGLEFVGQLLGLALRTGDLLPFSLAPFTWKGLVQEERTLEDLRGIDVFAARQIEEFDGEGSQDDEESFAVNGKPADGLTRAEHLLRRRLTFDAVQMEAMRRGLSTVVPIHLLSIWRWQDLRRRICGSLEVDLECLKRHTIYKNCADTDTPVAFLWQALEGFSQPLRRSFLRFVWGRSALPPENWERSFTVQLLSGSNDSRLPCSHTCFFTLDLPEYSSAEICRERLLYCINHCVTIDADGAAARSMNWDEDDQELT